MGPFDGHSCFREFCSSGALEIAYGMELGRSPGIVSDDGMFLLD